MASDRFTWIEVLGSLLLGTSLFVLNNLGVLAGWMDPPDGYLPNWMPRNTDFGQYFTWMRALQADVIIPNYHAPWLTEPALFNPALLIISRVANAFNWDLKATFHLFHFSFYLFAGFAFLYAIRAFTTTARERGLTLIVAVLSVPVQLSLVLPQKLFSRLGWFAIPQFPGIGDFVWWSSDGFFHGIASSPLVTLGTANTLLIFALLAKYFKTERKQYLITASAFTAFSALVHPFEVFAIVPAGSFALFLRKPKLWRAALEDATLLALAGLLGLLPYVFQTLRHGWLHDAAALNHWAPYSPVRTLAMMGLPMIGAILLSIFASRGTATTDLLLKLWIAAVLIGVYIPGMPHSQHLIDGVHYGGALLFVRLATSSRIVSEFCNRRRRLVIPLITGWAALALFAYGAIYVQSFRDGKSANPTHLMSGVVSRDEVSVVHWMEEHAVREDLVLAPARLAPWLAARPMHSFASHQIFSITFNEQLRLSNDFFAGTLDPQLAQSVLEKYGVHYVVVPAGSPGAEYLRDYRPVAVFTKFSIFENAGRSMRPYPSRKDADIEKLGL